jgi:hypothetical protein
VRQACVPALLVGDDHRALKRVVRPAIAGMPSGMTHAN